MHDRRLHGPCVAAGLRTGERPDKICDDGEVTGEWRACPAPSGTSAQRRGMRHTARGPATEIVASPGLDVDWPARSVAQLSHRDALQSRKVTVGRPSDAVGFATLDLQQWLALHCEGPRRGNTRRTSLRCVPRCLGAEHHVHENYLAVGVAMTVLRGPSSVLHARRMTTREPTGLPRRRPARRTR